MCTLKAFSKKLFFVAINPPKVSLYDLNNTGSPVPLYPVYYYKTLSVGSNDIVMKLSMFHL